MTGVDYFARRDPALDAFLSAPAPYPEVVATLRSEGAAAARALWKDLTNRYGTISWWEPFTWDEMNRVSLGLLDQKRIDDAIAGLEMNAERYPSRWEAWDSLGDGYRAVDRKADARQAYGRALQIAPDNWNAAYQRRMIRELQGPGTR